MDEAEKPATRSMSDAELARRMRLAEEPTFMLLTGMLGNDIRAMKAIREETEFIKTRPHLATGAKFAAMVRAWLIENKLEWSQENLEKAVEAVQAPAEPKP